MLAMELVQDLDLCHCFADGVAWIQLGPDITHEELADQIIRCVETIIAGDFRSTVRYSSDLMYVVERASRILKHVACLVVVDDVAGPNAQWAFDTVVRALGPSCVALFTVPTEPRGERPVRGGEPGGSDPLSMANVMCVAKLFVKPLEPASHEAGIIFRSWLTKSQSDQSRDGSLRHAKEQVTIVDACFGLPLPLAMTAGFLSRFHNSWSFLATQLASSKSPQDTIFRILHILLQRGGAKFRAQLKDIACLPCGVWVSLSTLADVWGMDYRTVKMSARRLGRMAFAEYRLGDSSDDSRVRFHWHLLQFSNTLASEQDVKLAHRKLIANISRRRSASQHLKQRFKTDYLPWWSGCVSDKYICRRLHWHISGAEALATLKDLICDYQWVCQRLERDGLLGIISEFLVALSAEEKDGCDVEVVGLKHVLSAIQQAASLRKSEGLEINALPTFLFSRLAQHERHSRCCRDFLNSIYEKARRPWLKPIPASEPPVLDLSALESVCSSDSMESESMPYLVNCLTSSVSGKVVYGDRLGNIQVYDPASGKNIVSWGSSPVGGGAHPLSRGVGALATVQDYVISGHLNGRMFLRSIRSGRTETIQNTGEGGGSGGSGGSGGNDKITCIATTEGGIVAVGTQTGRLFVLRTVQDFESVPQRIDLQGHCDVVTSLHIFPGGRRVASSSYDGFAAIWKIDDDDDDDGLQRISLNGHKPDIGHKENYITTFATICGGKRLLSSCRGGVVSAWNTDNGACIWTLRYGYEFSRTLSLYAFGVRYFTQAMTDGGEGAVERGKGGGVNLLNIGYPYVITRGEGPRDLLILAAGNGREVLATVTTDQVISTWMEVWHPSTQRIYIAVSHADGRLSSFELVTSLK